MKVGGVPVHYKTVSNRQKGAFKSWVEKYGPCKHLNSTPSFQVYDPLFADRLETALRVRQSMVFGETWQFTMPASPAT